MQITGKVHRIEQPTSREYNGKTYKEQKVIVELTEGQYTQHIRCNISRDNLIGKLQVGEVITADINLRGREYTNKQGRLANFTSIEIWRVSTEGVAQTTPQTTIDDNDIPF